MDVTLDDIQRALDGIADAFRDAPAEGGSIYDPPPDDDYEALVHEFGFHGWEAKEGKPGGIGLKVNYQITNHSTYAGRICGSLFNITDPARIGYLKGWLNTMGVNVEAPEFDIRTYLRPEPGGPLNALLDAKVLIRVKRSNGYVNIYLQQRIDDGSYTPSDVTPAQAGFEFATPVGRSAAGPQDDDIPF